MTRGLALQRSSSSQGRFCRNEMTIAQSRWPR
jgi:hypothetical protein